MWLAACALTLSRCLTCPHFPLFLSVSAGEKFVCKKIGTEGFDAAVCGCCGRVSGCFSAHHIYTYTHTHTVFRTCSAAWCSAAQHTVAVRPTARGDVVGVVSLRQLFSRWSPLNKTMPCRRSVCSSPWTTQASSSTSTASWRIPHCASSCGCVRRAPSARAFGGFVSVVFAHTFCFVC